MNPCRSQAPDAAAAVLEKFMPVTDVIFRIVYAKWTPQVLGAPTVFF